MKNEYIRSVSWFGGLARAYRTVNSRRLFFLGVAALMMAALFAAQAISGPGSVLGQATRPLNDDDSTCLVSEKMESFCGKRL